MTKLSIVLIYLIINLTGNAQFTVNYNSVLSKDDFKYLAKGDSIFHSTEDEIIFLMNFARWNGAFYFDNVIVPYLNSRKTKSNSYIRSLKSQLYKTSALPLLFENNSLHQIAKQYAIQGGNKGVVGHSDFEKRYTNSLSLFTSVGENISYGYINPIEIVNELLIDHGIANLGHRKNILNEKFNSIGVYIAPHKKYKTHCVISFGAR